MNFTEIALKFKTTVYVLILFIAVMGINAYRAMPLEDAPEIEIPFIMVQTIYPGVSPEDMERLVTNAIERELKELKDVKEITSSSSESVSMVTLEFETGIDTDDAYQKVRDKVDMAKPDLPADAEEPVVIEISTTDFPILLVSASADYSLMKLKSVGEFLEESIEQVPGVLSVDLIGGLEREIHVYLDPTRMEYYKIGVGQVINRIKQEHQTTPAGSIELGNSKYAVRIPGEYKDVSLMEDIVLKAPKGKAVKLRDIGRIVDGIKDRETISRSNGVECVTLRVKKQSGENIVRIAEDIKNLLDRLESSLPAGTHLTLRQDQSMMIRDQVKNLENSIITGLLLVMIVLWFALGFRNAAFVAMAIPLSMLITFAALHMMGVTLNMVVLVSLIIALGMLVDNSIVVIENIYRHVSEGESRVRAALLATKEVSWPIIASTATTVAAYSPIFWMPGIPGDFMKFLPQTVITALIATLFVALVINPVLASRFLRANSKKMFETSGIASGPILKPYQKTLIWSLDHPKMLIGSAVIFFIATVFVYGKLGAGVEFFPPSTPLRCQITFSGPQGTTLDQTDSIVRSVEAFARREDNSKEVVANVGIGGGSWMGSGGSSTHEGVIDLEFIDRLNRSHSTWDTIDSLRKQLSTIPGGEFRVLEEEKGPPTGDPISVELSGPDYNVLNEYAQKAIPLIRTIPGVIDIKEDFEGSKPEIQIIVDREKAMTRKVNSQDIAMAVSTAINGTTASVLREGDEEYDIVVQYEEQYRQSINDLLELRVTGEDDFQIPLRDVAEVITTGGLGSIKHIDGYRSVLISGDITGRSSSEVMADIEAKLSSGIELPPGYHFHFTGETEMQDEMADFLLEAFMIGIMIIMMILITQFNSISRPLIIIGTVAMSLNGVMLGLLITQNKFSVMMTGLGVISLAGIVVNNAIVLVDYVDQLRDKLGLPLREALIRAGTVRFRPVMLTAITTVLGMIPMALGISFDFTTMALDIGSENSEWWGPMGQAIIFGLLFATALTLILLPVLYYYQENTYNRIKALIQSLSSRKTTASDAE